MIRNFNGATIRTMYDLMPFSTVDNVTELILFLELMSWSNYITPADQHIPYVLLSVDLNRFTLRRTYCLGFNKIFFGYMAFSNVGNCHKQSMWKCYCNYITYWARVTHIYQYITSVYTNVDSFECRSAWLQQDWLPKM